MSGSGGLKWEIKDGNTILAEGLIADPGSTIQSNSDINPTIRILSWFDMVFSSTLTFDPTKPYDVVFTPQGSSVWCFSSERNGVDYGFQWPAAFTESEAWHFINGAWIRAYFWVKTEDSGGSNWRVVLYQDGNSLPEEPPVTPTEPTDPGEPTPPVTGVIALGNTAFVGDSLTRGDLNYNPPYGSPVDRIIAGLIAANFTMSLVGTGGTTSSPGNWPVVAAGGWTMQNMSTQFSALTQQKPQTIIVHIGANDAMASTANVGTATSNFLVNLLATQAQASGTKRIIVIGCREISWLSTTQKNILSQIKASAKAFCDAASTTRLFIDLNEAGLAESDLTDAVHWKNDLGVPKGANFINTKVTTWARGSGGSTAPVVATEISQPGQVLVAGDGAQWTITSARAALRNGVVAADNGDIKVLLKVTDGSIYAENASTGNWWKWMGSSWNYHGTTRPGGSTTPPVGPKEPGTPSVVDATGVAPVQIATGLAKPWAVQQVPGLTNSYLVTEKETGHIKLVTNASQTILTGVPTSFYSTAPVGDGRNHDGHGGMLDLILDKDFGTDSNRKIYFTHVVGTLSANWLSLKSADLASNALSISNVAEVLRVRPDSAFQAEASGTSQYGGRVVQGTDGNLFLMTGERDGPHTDPGYETAQMRQAQNLNSMLGKVLRCTPTGSVPSDNPYASASNANQKYVYARGFRNPLGGAIGPDGSLWLNQNHAGSGDNIIRVRPSLNYGWPFTSKGSHYGGADIPDSASGMEEPTWFSAQSMAPSGMLFFKGQSFGPGWVNRCIFGSLADYSGTGGRRVNMLIPNSAGTGFSSTTAARTTLWGGGTTGPRCRDVRQGSDGRILVIVDDGRLMRLDPIFPTAPPPKTTRNVDQVVNDMKLYSELTWLNVATSFPFANKGLTYQGPQSNTAYTNQWWKDNVGSKINRLNFTCRALLSWAVLARGTNHRSSNTRVALRNGELWLLNNSNVWVPVGGVSTTFSGSVYANTGFSQTTPDSEGRRDVNGSSEIALPSDSRNSWHGWWNQGIAGVDPSNIKAIYGTAQQRLVIDNPNGVDDRHLAEAGYQYGADWYPAAGQGWPNVPGGPNSWPPVACARIRKATNQWEDISFMTFSDIGWYDATGRYGITEALLRQIGLPPSRT